LSSHILDAPNEVTHSTTTGPFNNVTRHLSHPLISRYARAKYHPNTQDGRDTKTKPELLVLARNKHHRHPSSRDATPMHDDTRCSRGEDRQLKSEAMEAACETGVQSRNCLVRVIGQGADGCPNTHTRSASAHVRLDVSGPCCAMKAGA
jgi:hypothetical protein